MANNIKAGRQVVFAKQTAPFSSMGITSSNTLSITVCEPDMVGSFRTDKQLNTIMGTVEGKGYIFIAALDQDQNTYFSRFSSSGNVLLAEDGNELLPE